MFAFFCFIIGFFAGGLLGVLVATIENTEKQDDGMDDVFDELLRVAQEQPHIQHDEERKEDFERKFPKE